MGWMKNMLLGGLVGSAIKGHMASAMWAQKRGDGSKDLLPYSEWKDTADAEEFERERFKRASQGHLEGALAGAALAGAGTFMADQRKKQEAAEDRDERHMESIQQWARSQRYLAGHPTMTPYTPPAPSHASLFPTEDPRWNQ